VAAPFVWRTCTFTPQVEVVGALEEALRRCGSGVIPIPPAEVTAVMVAVEEAWRMTSPCMGRMVAAVSMATAVLVATAL